MRQHEMKANRTHYPTMKVVRAQEETQAELTPLVNAAWNFAYSALWNCAQFSTKEVDAAKEHITTYLQLFKNTREGFTTFCQRVLLARYHINNNNSRFAPLPSVWLDNKTEDGFTGTKQWYKEICAVRQSLPSYKNEIKALAEAVFEFSEEATVENYQYWRKYFIEKQTPGLLSLFQIVAIQQICNV